MSVLPIDPAAIGAVSELQVPGLDGSAPAAGGGPAAIDAPGDATGGESFGDLLGTQIANLSDLQQQAADASTALADGTATDASSVVIAVEKAQLAMQLAGQIRTRAAEAINDIFHTQI